MVGVAVSGWGENSVAVAVGTADGERVGVQAGMGWEVEKSRNGISIDGS
jgi:hypothetical protein